jgi:hypothetical protein
VEAGPQQYRTGQKMFGNILASLYEIRKKKERQMGKRCEHFFGEMNCRVRMYFSSFK